MNRFVPLLAVFLLAGCSSSLIRVAPPGPDFVPRGEPALSEVIDLGALPLAESGELDVSGSDGVATPGEWLALVGENLQGATAVRVAGQPAEVAGALQGGSILVRTPLGISAGRTELVVETPAGVAKTRTVTGFHVYGGDINGDAVRIRRTDPETGALGREPRDVAFDGARFLALSRDGGFLFVLQDGSAGRKDRDSSAVTCELLVLHLGAPEEPLIVGHQRVGLSNPPCGLVSGPRGSLVVVTARDLVVFDASAPTQPKQLRTVRLIPRDAERAQLVDAEFLGSTGWLVALDAYRNRLHLVDLRDPAAARRAGDVALGGLVGEPYSIDLAAGPDGASVWVLQGPNLRLSGRRMLDGLKEVWSDVKALELGEAVDTIGETAGRSAMLDEGICRLVDVRLEGERLRVARAVATPADLFPFFVQPSVDGRALYVSGINRAALDLSRLELSLDGLEALLDLLKETAQLGRVVKIDAATGERTTVLQGVSIYYDLDLMPGGRLISSLIRLGPGYFPPRVTLDWGVEVAGGKFRKLREVANSAFGLADALQRLLPPYAYERIGVQR